MNWKDPVADASERFYATNDYGECNHLLEKSYCSCFKERELIELDCCGVYQEEFQAFFYHHYSSPFCNQFFVKLKHYLFGFFGNHFFFCFFQCICVCLFLLVSPISARIENISQEKYSTYTKPTFSVGVLYNNTKCIKSCSLSFSNGSEKDFCGHHQCCATVYSNCLKTAILHEKNSTLNTSVEFSIATNAMSPQNQTIMLEKKCQKLCDVYHLRYQLFCNHYYLSSLLPLNFTNDCEKNLLKVRENDKTAFDVYSSFERILNHYVSSQSYSNNGNSDLCLSSYKKWACSIHHQVYAMDEMSGSWKRMRPCPSLCTSVEASCPFFRIGNKSKHLGSQAAFLCKGNGGGQGLTRSPVCYETEVDLLPCSVNRSVVSPALSPHTSVAPTAFAPSFCLVSSPTWIVLSLVCFVFN